jgi:hypothetical protein
MNVDPTISGQNGNGFGSYGMAVNLHNASDGAAFHDELGLQAPFVPRFTTFAHSAQLAILPAPKLKFLFHIELELDVMREVGDGPFGRRSFAGVRPLLLGLAASTRTKPLWLTTHLTFFAAPQYKGGQWEGPGTRGIVPCVLMPSSVVFRPRRRHLTSSRWLSGLAAARRRQSTRRRPRHRWTAASS